MQLDEAATAPGAAVRWLEPVKFRLEEMREVLGLLEEWKAGARATDARPGVLVERLVMYQELGRQGQRSCTNAGRTLPGSPTPCARHEERPRQTRESY
jgi:hypothetical protein